MYQCLPFTDKETGSEWLSTFLKVTQLFVVGWVSQAADCGRDWHAGLTGCALGIHAWGQCGHQDGMGGGLGVDAGASDTSASLKQTEARVTLRDVLNWSRKARPSLMWTPSWTECPVGKAAPSG